MAITKILVVRNKLDRMINYANNPDKTSLENALDYAMNAAKTERTMFQSTINCMPGSAYQDMRDTKRRWGKEDGVLAYHIIQSFTPGEVTPQIAHEIGCEFARRVFGERFEAVVATHLDKAHLHNHIVLNSVSFVDGRKYRSNIGSYYGEIRSTSDAICAEYSLSVLKGERRGKKYGEWKQDNDDHVVWRDVIRRDMDAAIRQSLSLQQFYGLLRAQGYTVDVNPKHKYVTVRAPGMQRAVRMTSKSLGADYTPESIAKRILNIPYIATDDGARKPFRLRGAYKPIKLKGLRALYFRYMYELGFIKKRPRRIHMSKELRAEVRKLDAYAARMRMLNDHRIETMEQLRACRQEAKEEIDDLTAQRAALHRMKEGLDDDARLRLADQTNAITARLKKLRTEIRHCDAIEVERDVLPARLADIEQRKKEQLATGHSELRKCETEHPPPRAGRQPKGRPR